MGLGLCFILSYIAERYFGIADITGAYIAGIILCNIHDASYIDRKISINSYMIFAPVFFVGIGLKTDFSMIDSGMILFSIAFVIVAMLTKVIGCGLTFLEVSANPYVTLLGPRPTGSSRLNMAQSFNGLGCVLAPLIVGQFLFATDDADVSIPCRSQKFQEGHITYLIAASCAFAASRFLASSLSSSFPHTPYCQDTPQGNHALWISGITGV